MTSHLEGCNFIGLLLQLPAQLRCLATFQIWHCRESPAGTPAALLHIHAPDSEVHSPLYSTIWDHDSITATFSFRPLHLRCLT